MKGPEREKSRTGLSIEALTEGFRDHLLYSQGRPLEMATTNDMYMLLADYQSYIDCQNRVSHVYQDQEVWTTMSILNTARMAKFSSDRTIRQYCEEIWGVTPVPVHLEDRGSGSI